MGKKEDNMYKEKFKVFLEELNINEFDDLYEKDIKEIKQMARWLHIEIVQRKRLNEELEKRIDAKSKLIKELNQKLGS